MAVLEAEKLDGSAYRLKVTARAKQLVDHEPLRRIDLGNVAESPNLSKLTLAYEGRVALEIRDLRNLAELRILSVGVSEFPDLSQWPDCPLTELSLSMDQAPVDLNKLRSCSQLTNFSLSTKAREFDLSPLEGLPIAKLALDVRHLAAIDWAALARLPKLTDLGVTMPNGVTVDLSGFSTLRDLRISMGDYRTLDLAPLAGKGLETFDVFGNDSLAEIELQHLANPSLRAVLVKSRGVKAASVAGFEVASGLRNVDLGSTSLESFDVRPLDRLRKINGISVPPGCRLHYDPSMTVEDYKKTSVGLWNLLCDELI